MSRKLTLAALGLSALVGAFTFGSAPAEAHGYGYGGYRHHGGYHHYHYRPYRSYGYRYHYHYGHRPYYRSW